MEAKLGTGPDGRKVTQSRCLFAQSPWKQSLNVGLTKAVASGVQLMAGACMYMRARACALQFVLAMNDEHRIHEVVPFMKETKTVLEKISFA